MGYLVRSTQKLRRLVHSPRSGERPETIHRGRLGSYGYGYLVVTITTKHFLEQGLHVAWP